MFRTTLPMLTIVSCLTLALGVPAFSEPQLEQPSSIARDAALAIETDQNVMPAGCTGSCGSGETASGRAVCCPKRVTKEVKKQCWKVKSERICIPSFRFQCNWWKRGKSRDGGDTCCSSSSCTDCPPKCGHVRCINVLEKHETTCEECGYEWEFKCVRTGKGGCCGDDCPSCGCAAE
ncbi:MAG: hypothetical protein GXP24_09485 [Planctomycetes bacterium]|nr:hypothetical protein [Planctomycetota bacterium]